MFFSAKELSYTEFIFIYFNVTEMRKQYAGGSVSDGLEIESLGTREPLGLFKQWFELASKTRNISEANAMTLATATK